MPPFKQPTSLQELSLCNITTHIKQVCQEDWNAKQLKKWQELHRFLFAVLPINFRNFITTQTLSVLETMLLYHYPEKVVENMVTACLHPDLTELNFPHWCHMNSLETTLWRELPKMSKLQNVTVCSNEQEQSLFNTSLLLTLPKHLVAFTMKFECSNDVISVLGQCCQQLQYLDITWSSSVTDESVQHICRLRQLKEVLLTGTSLTVQGFQFLIQEGKMRLERFEGHNATTHFIKHLTETCPELTSVSISRFEGDISALKELKHIQELNLSKSDFNVVNGLKFLEEKGSSLKALYLCTVSNISVSVIGQFCTKLKTLKIYQCLTFEQTSLPEQSFQSLEDVAFSPCCPSTYLEYFLTSSRYLRRLVITVASGIDDNFISNILVKNSLEKLQELMISGPRISCGMNSVYMLIQRCPLLTNLGNLGHWVRLTKEEVDCLRLDLKQRNLNLTIFFQFPGSVDLFKSLQ